MQKTLVVGAKVRGVDLVVVAVSTLASPRGKRITVVRREPLLMCQPSLILILVLQSTTPTRIMEVTGPSTVVQVHRPLSSLASMPLLATAQRLTGRTCTATRHT